QWSHPSMLSSMSHGLSLSPFGRLICLDAPESAIAEQAVLPKQVAEQVIEAFAESSAAGLIALAPPHSARAWGAGWGVWRELSRWLFTALCGLGEASPAQWQQIPPPAEQELAERASSAPPMRGLEYLTAAVLRNLWSELVAEVSKRAAAWNGGPSAFLADV